jgi:hypothetical protein
MANHASTRTTQLYDRLAWRRAAGGGEAGGVACRVVVLDEVEIELGLGVELQAGEWAK